MECRVTLKRLTEVEIRDAIANSPDDNSSEFETEEDVALDDFSEDESDHESADEHESSDADYEGSETEEEDTTTQSTEFVGRDGTTWNESPHAKSRMSHNVNRNALSKVNLLRGQKIDSAEIAFDCFFTKEVIDAIVKFTNMEGKRVKSDWKNVDDIEIRAFIGLLIAAGVERGSKRNYVEFFDHLRRPTYFPGDNGLESLQIYFAIHTF